MKQLSGLDAAFLFLETPEMPMHVGALNIYELPRGHKGSFVAQLRHHIEQRLPMLPVFRRRVWWMPLNLANPAWVDAKPDLKKHVVSVKLPKSAAQGDGMAEVEAAVGKLHSEQLDRKRPLWRFFVLEGLAPTADGRKRVGVYSQFHHAAVDGQAAVAIAQVLLDLTPEPRALDIHPSKRPRTLRLGVGQMLRGAIASEVMQITGIINGLPSTLGTLAGAAGVALSHTSLLRLGGNEQPTVSNVTLAPRTILNQSITAQRVFAGVSLPLPELKAIGKAHDATVNDLVLLLCGTALRHYLLKRDQLPPKSLIAAVPISLRAQGDTTSDTQASMSLVSLGTHLADMRRRFAHVKRATAAMKETMGKLKSILPTNYPSIGVPWLMEAAVALYGKAKVADRMPLLANVAISNVPGPPVPLYLASARMACNYPTSIVTHGLALNITVESYDKQMDFGLVASADAMPDVRALADEIRQAFEALRMLHAKSLSRATRAAPKPAAPTAKPAAARKKAAVPTKPRAPARARSTR
ncbi:MAG: wax ester/triacylglycerol synthase family O-acyltransferase [Burkholderiales bacterium]|nr:wax ester/triacylglycerol synthase family O-acyltransferase [Burkholderiales bacterium]